MGQWLTSNNLISFGTPLLPFSQGLSTQPDFAWLRALLQVVMRWNVAFPPSTATHATCLRDVRSTGVKFGLSGGRVESIMVSAPPLVSWAYNHIPEEGSEEDRLLQILRNPREWVS